MFGEMQGESSVNQCKPDPEEQLQRARQRIADCDRAEELVFELGELSFAGRIKADAFAEVLGNARMQRYSAKKDESRWLKEIDKE